MTTENNHSQHAKGRFAALRTSWRKARDTFRARYPKLYRGLKYSFWAAALLVFLLCIFVLSVYFGAFGPLPTRADLKKINTPVASEVYSADGRLLGKYYRENRIFVPLDSISRDVIHALISTEDERFFKHKGVDLRGLARVLVKTILLRKQTGGGSTLSQQLVKNIFKRNEDHGILTLPVIKVKEMLISHRMEKIYTKDQLLELYLNTVPFGNRIFGIEVAANRYFGKHASQLNTEEAATLIGMLKATTYYNPVTHPDRSIRRRNLVLAQMAKNGYLTPAQLTKLQKRAMKTSYRKEGSNEGPATYLRERVRLDAERILSRLHKPDGKAYNLYTDGLRIYTTIDTRLQAYAEWAVQRHMSRLQAVFDRHWRKRRKPWLNNKTLSRFIKQSDRYAALEQQHLPKERIYESFLDTVRMRIFTWKGLRDTLLTPKDSVAHYLSLLNAGLLAVDARTGAVKAWVGGIDFRHLKYDQVLARRQVGSTFKPLVYAAALEAGRSPCEYISNDSLRIQDDDKWWTPANAEQHYGGYYSMAGALTHSVNVAAARMILQTGIAPVARLARRAGFQSDIPRVPSIALGSLSGSLEEMCTVYTSFARQGETIHPFYLSRIETADGQVLYKAPRVHTSRATSPATAGQINEMLQMVVDSGTARRLYATYHLPRGIAGKTGTTQHQADGWFIGYTPRLVMGVRVGGMVPAVRFRSLSLGQGANMALPIWALTMQRIIKNRRLYQYAPAAFPPLPDSLAARMNCPPFVESLIARDNEIADADGEEGFLERAIRKHREKMRKRKSARQRRAKAHKRKKKGRLAKWLERLFKKH